MTADLIQKLRICSAEERRAVAIELAKTRSEEAIAELKRMVEGRHRKGLKWYNYDDQLVGIEALGNTNNDEALNFLAKVYSSLWSYGSVGELICTYKAQGSGDLPSWDSVRTDSYDFPWARGELRRRLAYSVELNTPHVEDYTLASRSEEEIEAELREILSREPHSSIQRVIRGLEASTRKTAQIVTIDSWSFYGSRNKEKLVAEYLQGKYESSRQSHEKHSPQAFLRK